MIVNRII